MKRMKRIYDHVMVLANYPRNSVIKNEAVISVDFKEKLKKKTSFINEINQCCLHLQRSLLSRADGRTVLDYLANNCEKYMYDIDSSIGLSWVIISPLILALNQDYVKYKMAMRII